MQKRREENDLSTQRAKCTTRVRCIILKKACVSNVNW